MDQTVLEMVMRHIREAEARVQHQRHLVDRMAKQNLPTEEAKALLAEFELNLANHRLHLDLLLKPLRAA